MMARALFSGASAKVLRHLVDAHCHETLEVETGAAVVVVTVVRTAPFRDGAGRALPWDAALLRREAAHWRTGYRGSIVCRVCDGSATCDGEPCRHCRDGVARHVCGDCSEPLPLCACLRDYSARIERAFGGVWRGH